MGTMCHTTKLRSNEVEKISSVEEERKEKRKERKERKKREEKEEERKRPMIVPQDLWLTDGQNLSEQEAKFVYTTRALRSYKN